MVGQLRVQREDGSVEILEDGASWDDDSSSTSSSASALCDVCLSAIVLCLFSVEYLRGDSHRVQSGT